MYLSFDTFGSQIYLLVLPNRTLCFLQPSNQITALPNAISRKIKWALKILPVQLDPMPRGIGIEEKQKELFAAI